MARDPRGGHPRRRGEHLWPGIFAALRVGSSPQARVTSLMSKYAGDAGGVIPAGAGNMMSQPPSFDP